MPTWKLALIGAAIYLLFFATPPDTVHGVSTGQVTPPPPPDNPPPAGFTKPSMPPPPQLPFYPFDSVHQTTGGSSNYQ